VVPDFASVRHEVFTGSTAAETDEDRRVDDLSVDHPDLAQHYRSAVTVRDDSDTEGLREAFVDYRALFEALLQTVGERETNPR
jgi:hypothetical protein